MSIYPENHMRGKRLQQLDGDMISLQNDLQQLRQTLEEKSSKSRPAIDASLKLHGMASVDDVFNKTASQMNPDDAKTFNALVETVKESVVIDGFDPGYFVASLLMALEGVDPVTSESMIAIACWGVCLASVNALAAFCYAVTGPNEDTAAEAASEKVLAWVAEAQKTLQGAVGVTNASVLLARLATFFKVLTSVGLVVPKIVGAILSAQRSEQKDKLVAAIHALQTARLVAFFFRKEGQSVTEQLETLRAYFEESSLAQGDPMISNFLAKRLIQMITDSQNHATDLNKLESDLESEDRTESLFYSGDDLTHDEVVAAASGTTSTST